MNPENLVLVHRKSSVPAVLQSGFFPHYSAAQLKINRITLK